MRTRVLPVLAAALLVVVGCAPSAATAALPAGITVELRQLRSDVADRTAQIRVTNDTDETIEIDEVAFDDDRFDGTAVRERHSTITAGRTVDLRIQLPASRCDPATDEARSRVVLTLADGTAWEADVADPLGFVPPLHDRECLAQAVAETAGLTWTAFEADAGAGTLLLSVDPAGGDHDLELVEVRETNLLQFPEGARSLPLDRTVDPTGDPSTIDVPLVPARCDPHAVMEDKRGTVFSIIVRLDGVEGAVDLPTGDVLRGRIFDWIGATCGFPTG